MDKFINICEADIQKKKFGKFVKTLRTPNVKVFICAFKQKNGFVPNIFICSKKKKKKKRKEGEKKKTYVRRNQYLHVLVFQRLLTNAFYRYVRTE